MFKRIVLFYLLFFLPAAGWTFYSQRTPDFSCATRFSVAQDINSDRLIAEGLLSLNMTKGNVFIRIDGLLDDKQQKHVISRVVNVRYKDYDEKAGLYKVTHIETYRDSADDVDDRIASRLFFSKDDEKKLIYIRKVGEDVVFLGNGTFPQYGCRRQ